MNLLKLANLDYFIKGLFIPHVNKIRRFQVFLWPSVQSSNMLQLTAAAYNAPPWNSLCLNTTGTAKISFAQYQSREDWLDYTVCRSPLTPSAYSSSRSWLPSIHGKDHCLPVLSRPPLQAGCPWLGSIFTQALPSQTAPEPQAFQKG